MNKLEAIRRLYEIDLSKNEIATMFMEYSSVFIRLPEKTILIDPADLISISEINEIKSLDLIVFTHGHYDHYDRSSTLNLFKNTGAKVVAEPMVYSDLAGRIDPASLFEASPGESFKVDDVEITPISGVHIGPINLYLIKVGEITVFHGGDSGYISLSGLKADIAYIPTGDPSPTASPENGLNMVRDLNPKIAIPIHGSHSQFERFRSLVESKFPSTKVNILEKWKPEKITL